MSGFVYSTDKNQCAVMDDLTHLGVRSRSVAGARGAGLDIICEKYGVNLLVELKSKGKRNDLRESEKWMRDNWEGPWIVAESAEEIYAWFCEYANKFLISTQK